MRAYAIWIPADTICILLGNWRNYQYIALPWLERCADEAGNCVNLPRDYVVTDATYDWQRKAVGIRLEHDSFPEVQPGAMVPSLYFREITIESRRVINPDAEDGPIIVEALPS